MSIEVAMRCPCGTHAVVDTTDAYSPNDRWSCHCPSCLDPTEDGGERSHLQGYGRTPEDAIADWWHRCEEAWEIDYVPNPLFAAISEQVGDEADRQEGWLFEHGPLGGFGDSCDYYGPPEGAL